MRSLLYAAGSTLITCTRKPSSLRAWATRLSARKGHKKASVAAARKLAVILHSIWRDGTVFDPGTQAIA